MHFRDRAEAGRLLANALKNYKGSDVVVYALPRGGVVTALEIAKYLDAPIDLIITRKIGHPLQPEYAIAATAENGHMVRSEQEIETVDKEWLAREIKEQRLEAARRKTKFLQGKAEVPVEGKIAILVDDGVATGLTIRVGIIELKHRHPQKIVVAVPVVPEKTAGIIKREANELIALDIPPEYEFLGAVCAYYDEFSPVEDEDVIVMLNAYDDLRKEREREILPYGPKLQTDPVLFTLSPYEFMALNLKQLPNITIGKFTLERFLNQELHIKLHSECSERPCIVLGTIAPNETNLVSFLLLCHTLKKEGAHSITALLPYLAYSRQDKKEPHKSYGTAFIGSILLASGVDEVVTVDVHSPHVARLFSIPLISLSPAKLFARELINLSMKDATIVAPDEGAVARAKALAREAGIKRKVVYMVKERTEKGVVHSKLYGRVSKKAVILDDILDTGGTLISACEILRKKGVREIIIMVTHGLFSGDKWKKLWKLGVKRIYCTNSVPLRPEIKTGKIKILSIFPNLSYDLKTRLRNIMTAKPGLEII